MQYPIRRSLHQAIMKLMVLGLLSATLAGLQLTVTSEVTVS